MGTNGVKGRILIVDDEIMVIRAITRLLDDGPYEIYHTTDPMRARGMLTETPMDVIISDNRMPGMSGLEVLTEARAVSPETVRILMSGYSDINIVIDAVNNGQIYRYVTKPWDDRKLLDAVDSAVKLKSEREEKDRVTLSLLRDKERWAEAVDSLASDLAVKKENTINAMLRIIKAKDEELYRHSIRVADLAGAVASGLHLREPGRDAVRLAGLFHDIGKISIRDRILYKDNSLDREEFDVMKTHPSVGAEILREVDFLGAVADIVEQHHEWLDGSGYPKRLAGGEILPEALILSVADSYDALTEDRVYRAAMAPGAAVKILRAGAGAHYSADAVEALAGLKLAGEEHGHE